MQTSSITANPFMQLLNPQIIIAAVERSEKLAQLTRRVCYPLDRIALPAQGAQGADGASTQEGPGIGDEPGLMA